MKYKKANKVSILGQKDFPIRNVPSGKLLQAKYARSSFRQQGIEQGKVYTQSYLNINFQNQLKFLALYL